MNTHPVSLEGGWRGDGAMRIVASDPHNNNTLIELTIPERTFINMLRNYGGYRPPVGELRVFPKSFAEFGFARQRGRLVLPIDSVPTNADEFAAFVQMVVPDGWHTTENKWNSHHRKNDTYHLGIWRTVEHTTPVEAEIPLLAPDGTRVEFPWEQVWYGPAEWEAEP